MTSQVFHDLTNPVWGINEVLSAPKRTWAWDGDPSFLFKNLSFYNINNQQAKFDKNLSAGSSSVEWT